MANCGRRCPSRSYQATLHLSFAKQLARISRSIGTEIRELRQKCEMLVRRITCDGVRRRTADGGDSCPKMSGLLETGTQPACSLLNGHRYRCSHRRTVPAAMPSARAYCSMHLRRERRSNAGVRRSSGLPNSWVVVTEVFDPNSSQTTPGFALRPPEAGKTRF
jgi:hypothetical protein